MDENKKKQNLTEDRRFQEEQQHEKNLIQLVHNLDFDPLFAP